MTSKDKLDFIKSIASDLANKYRIWYVSCEKPLVDDGFESMMKHGRIEYIYSPYKSNANSYYIDDDDDWKHEIAMQAGMLGGCEAYNDIIC